jgi:hypothetical protein
MLPQGEVLAARVLAGRQWLQIILQPLAFLGLPQDRLEQTEAQQVQEQTNRHQQPHFFLVALVVLVVVMLLTRGVQ